MLPANCHTCIGSYAAAAPKHKLCFIIMNLTNSSPPDDFENSSQFSQHYNWLAINACRVFLAIPYIYCNQLADYKCISLTKQRCVQRPSTNQMNLESNKKSHIPKWRGVCEPFFDFIQRQVGNAYGFCIVWFRDCMYILMQIRDSLKRTQKYVIAF